MFEHAAFRERLIAGGAPRATATSLPASSNDRRAMGSLDEELGVLIDVQRRLASP
ncbi:MAG: hypothetical protein U5O39_11875 [Gammaproteobacteria bacterium]|nr:hypothetical protein [Gammaproteobacteria bacterium]